MPAVRDGVVLDVVVAEEGVHVVTRQVEVGLDDALVGSLLDGLRVGPLSQEQGDGAEDDTLTGTRLSRNDREARIEFNIQFINQRIMT